RFVACARGHIFDVLIVESVRNCETIHLNAEPLFQRLLASAYFILQPLFVLGWAELFLRYLVIRFAQVLVRFRMRMNVNPSIAHIRELFPGNGFAAAKMPTADAFGVNEHRKGVAKFLHNWPGHVVLRFPAVIESDNGATRRNIFFAALPGQEILHPDYSDAAILQVLHLLFKHLGRDFGIRPAHLIDETVISINDDLCCLVDRHLCWRSWGCDRGHGWQRRSARRGRGGAGWGRSLANSLGLLLFVTGRQAKGQKHRNCYYFKSHKREKRL